MKLAGFFVCLMSAAAQDNDLKRQIDAETRTIYDAAKTRIFRLAAACPPGLKLCDITGYYAGETLARVVVSGWEERGRLSVEYFLRGGALIFTYESFEYLPESAPIGGWKNFKGLPSWERRTYYRGAEAGHVETQGTGALPPLGVTVRQLRALLATNR